MQLFLTGAESSTHLDTLKACGAHRVALSITNLARHTPHYGDWASNGRLNGLDWVVYADSTSVPAAPVLELLHGAPTEPEAVIGPVEWANTWLGESDILFLPLWDGRDPSELRDYLESFDGVVLPDSVVDNVQAVRTAKSAIGPMQQVGGLTGRSKGVDRFDMLVSSAWWAVPKHGETQVWTGNRLVRLNAEDKHQKRNRYADEIEALGCDVSAVLSDDPTETSRLAILSWMAMEKHLNQGRTLVGAPAVVTNGDTPGDVTGGLEVASGATPTRHAGNSQRLLPVMETSLVSMDDGSTMPLMESTERTLLQCNTCVLSSACPGFQQGSACHYAIPVQIRTRDQRRSVMQTLTEIQTQRILMESFREQVNGEREDAVGKEMDRLFNMLKTMRDVEETQSFTMTMKATGETNNSGAISRLFGSEAGKNAQVLDVPLVGEEVLEEHLT